MHAGVPKQNFGLAAPDVSPQKQPYPSYQTPGPAPPPPAPLPHHNPTPPIPPNVPPRAFPGSIGSAPDGRAAAGPAKRTLSVKEKEEAKKLAKQVVSALNFDDNQSAVDLLQKALAVLTE